MELFVKKQGMPSSRNLLSAYSCLIGIGTPRKKKSKSEIIEGKFVVEMTSPDTQNRFIQFYDAL